MLRADAGGDHAAGNRGCARVGDFYDGATVDDRDHLERLHRRDGELAKSVLGRHRHNRDPTHAARLQQTRPLCTGRMVPIYPYDSVHRWRHRRRNSRRRRIRPANGGSRPSELGVQHLRSPIDSALGVNRGSLGGPGGRPAAPSSGFRPHRAGEHRMTPDRARSDSAQVRVFRDLLDDEIERSSLPGL